MCPLTVAEIIHIILWGEEGRYKLFKKKIIIITNEIVTIMVVIGMSNVATLSKI